ncbi:hypothetical protein ACFVGN_05670 [Streptomyces sp. NPDC057757]|uniref:hypothetical protein n=1 Tax=Streptomyces sp. NPDC057757 TaxID=3346241 RepID=UPI0036C367DE
MSVNDSGTWIRRTSTAAGLAYTAIAEYELARRLGAEVPIAVMLPLALDCYVIAALTWFRAFDVFLSLTLMCAAQVCAHALDAGVVTVSLDLVAVVSLLVPIALWRTHALARGEGADPARSSAPEYAAAVERVPVPAEPPPVPEAYPALTKAVPAVPLAVPPDARLLTTATTCGLPPQRPGPDGTGEEPEDDPVYPDPLIPQVRAAFPDEVPGVRRLRETYRIGQPRAQRIRDELMGVRA